MKTEKSVPDPPTGWGHVRWLGPAFLWMVSAAGSGELLFTPRVAAQYGYTLLWALLAAVILKWFINHEIGRWAVCTGSPVLEGFSRLPGRWGRAALWLIVLPQLVNAVAITAGMAGAAATAAILIFPFGGVQFWAVALIALASGLVLWGKYGAVEKISTFLAIALAVAAVTGAVSVFPSPGKLAAGLAPSLPPEVDFSEILPWLGFMLSGAAGLMWYSYWTTAKGYGAAGARGGADKQDENDDSDDEPVRPQDLPDEQKKKLRGWLGQMTLDNTVAVVGTLLPTIGFLILGAELLQPRGLVPAENEIARTVARLLEGVFGRWGYWLMVAGVFIGFSGTLISQQDGFSRLFADGTRNLAEKRELGGRWTDPAFLQKAYIVGLLTILPVAVYLIFGEPVGLLKVAGAIEAAHIPIVAALVLYLNQKMLPDDLKPNAFLFGGAIVAALFFAAFAVTYVLQFLGVL